jgi:hypothetical protein
MQVLGIESRPGSIRSEPVRVKSNATREAFFPIKRLAVMGLIMTVVVAFLATPFLDPGRLLLFVVCAGALALCSLIFLAIGALTPSLLLLRIVTFAFMMQMFWMLLITLVDAPTFLSNSVITTDVTDYPLEGVLPLLLVPLVALGACLVLWLFLKKQRSQPSILSTLVVRPPNLSYYLVFAAVVQLLYWPAAVKNSGSIGYFIRATSYTLTFAPLIAGRYSATLPKTHRMWLIAMSINAAIGLLVGSRLIALLPPSLYMLGYVVSLRGRARMRMAAFGGALFILALMLSGIVGLVRQEVGRGGIEILSSERVSSVVDSATKVIEGQQTVSAEPDSTITTEGLSRLVVWTNIVVPIMTPSILPYRGYEELPNEIVLSMQFANFSGARLEDLLDAGMFSAPANSYGFTVNTETSVEWGILADGWSRDGASGVVLFAFIAMLVLLLAEQLIYGVRKLPRAAKLFLFSAYAKNSLGVVTVPLLTTVRTMVLDTAIILFVVLAINLWQHQAKGFSRAKRNV